jgi:hypothetical protein
MYFHIATALLGCLLLSGCGGDGGSSTPTTPTTPPSSSSLVIGIGGALSSPSGAPLEATLLLDGREIQGARITCQFTAGCPAILMNPGNLLEITPGQHTVSFQLIRQAASGRMPYSTSGLAIVRRGAATVQNITLVERTANLIPTESISYQITVSE